MKKKFVLFVLIALFVIAPAFAANDIYVDLGIQNSELSLDLFNNNKFGAKFNASVAGEFTMIIDKGMGFSIDALADLAQSEIDLGVNFAYAGKISQNVLYILTVGPSFDFGTNVFSIGADFEASFLFFISRSMYISVATGVDMNFVDCKSGSTESNFCMNIPIPSVGFGWKF